MLWAEFIVARAPELWARTGEHLFLTGLAMAIAVIIGVPLAIACRRSRAMRGWVLGAVGIAQTVPSLAMLAILLSLLGMIGAVPAIIALALYALLPIVRNTVTGLDGVGPQIIEAAKAMGMTTGQQLRIVRIPLALPVIAAGVRTAAVTCVGIATLSAFIGAGGLGQFINRGLALDDYRLIMLGAIPSACLALLVDFSIWGAEWSLRPGRRTALAKALRGPAMAMPLLLAGLGVAASVIDLTPAPVGQLAGSVGRIGRPGVIRVASKEFGEQLLLGEIMAQLIEARTNLTVERRLGLGGTDICNSALKRGEIDLYPEYTGTAYRSILKITGDVPGPYGVYCTVRREYSRKFDAEWLEPFGFENTYAIAVRRQDAEDHGWRSISDLTDQADKLRAGFTSEFQERQDGYPGFKKEYGISFGRAVDIGADLMYQALAKKEVDVICAFSTDGRIAAYDLLPLKDDKRFWPPYDAAPVVRSAFLAEHPEVQPVLGLLAGLLDNATMRKLNYEMQGEKRPPADVARQFLQSKDLIR